jgi:uncharacterized protein (TIGR02246 family)
MDEREIRQLLELQVEAWNRSDLAGFCAFYAEDAVYVRPAAPVVGRQALHDEYAARFGHDTGTLTLDLVKLEIRADAAFALVQWHLLDTDRTGHALLGLRRGPNGWELAYDASM